MCVCFGRMIFVFAMLIFLLPTILIVRILLCFSDCCPACLPKVHACSKVLFSWSNWLSLRFCQLFCVIGLRVEGMQEMDASLYAAAGRPRLIILNHTSFMDALAATAFLRGRIAVDVSALVSAHLFANPLLAVVGRGCGYFAVPFKSHETKKAENERVGSIADFAVDRDAMQTVLDQFEDWVKTGHVGAWFPEGRLNPNPENLQTFRAGGFQIAVDADAEIWCACAAGFEVFWNRKAPIGGTPANCGAKCFKLCDSSSALIKELAKGDDTIDDKQKRLLIANYAQAKFQEVRDELTADPWISKLPQPAVDAGTALAERAS